MVSQVNGIPVKISLISSKFVEKHFEHVYLLQLCPIFSKLLFLNYKNIMLFSWDVCTLLID